MVSNNRLKNQVDKFGGKLVLTNIMTIVWKNWMTNLVYKFNWNNQAHKLGVRFGEIIGLKNLVEYWVDNLVTKLGVQLS